MDELILDGLVSLLRQSKYPVFSQKNSLNSQKTLLYLGFNSKTFQVGIAIN
jgi:hypothetical protein